MANSFLRTCLRPVSESYLPLAIAEDSKFKGTKVDGSGRRHHVGEQGAGFDIHDRTPAGLPPDLYYA